MPGSSPGMTANASQAPLLHRDPRELHHLAPFVGFVGNQLAEPGRRHFWPPIARFPAAPRRPVWLFCVGFCVLFALQGNRAVPYQRDQRLLATAEAVPGSMPGPAR